MQEAEGSNIIYTLFMGLIHTGHQGAPLSTHAAQQLRLSSCRLNDATPFATETEAKRRRLLENAFHPSRKFTNGIYRPLQLRGAHDLCSTVTKWTTHVVIR